MDRPLPTALASAASASWPAECVVEASGLWPGILFSEQSVMARGLREIQGPQHLSLGSRGLSH